MKSNPKIIEMLNVLLADEFAAYNQYRAHASLNRNLFYVKLADEQDKRAESEAEHIKELMARIALLGGEPVVSKIGETYVCKDVKDQHTHDGEAEQRAIDNYNQGVRMAMSAGDNGTRQLLEHILVEEEEHLNQVESQLTQIEQMGVDNYLGTKV